MWSMFKPRHLLSKLKLLLRHQALVTFGRQGFGTGLAAGMFGVLVFGRVLQQVTALGIEVVGITRLVVVGTTVAVTGVKFSSIRAIP
jgi:hypothetical protein